MRFKGSLANRGVYAIQGLLLLLILHNRGGRAERKSVRDEIVLMLRDAFEPDELQPETDPKSRAINPNNIWYHRLDGRVKVLRDEGYLSRSGQRGYWEITSKGRERIESVIAGHPDPDSGITLVELQENLNFPGGDGNIPSPPHQPTVLAPHPQVTPVVKPLVPAPEVTDLPPSNLLLPYVAKEGVSNYGRVEPEVGLEDVHPELEPEAEPEILEVDDRPVVSQATDWAIVTLRDMDDKGKIDRQPRYQRQYVWELKPELQSRLIESILLEIPIPPIYLGKVPGGHLEVIDGQQRLTTVLRFVRNEFALQKLRRLPSLKDHFFRDLSEEHQDKILHTPIHSVVIDAGKNDNLRYEIFERLNRGSMALNEQELRNCIFRGPFSNLLDELESSEVWRKVKGTPEPESRFAEREMILRFFAFADRIDYYRGNLRKFLNEYMEKHAPRDPEQPQDPEKIIAMRAKFKQTMQNVYAVFGEHSGRLYSTGTEDHPTIEGKWDPKFSISALDIQASALMGHPPAKVQTAAEQIREAYLFYLLTNPQVRLAISRQPAGTNPTRTRWFGFKGLVQEIFNNANAEPRFFSYDFRRQLYERSNVCAICRNEIHTFEDCTVDHIIPCARGGKTVHSNAQLAHRSCNARKYTTEVQPTLSKDPLADARMFLQVGHVIPAGAIAGLVLERQLKLLCERRQPPIPYERGDSISKINNLLKEAGVYDLAQWRLIQWMGDIRNRCDHPTDSPPTKEDVDKLIKEVKTFVTSFPT